MPLILRPASSRESLTESLSDLGRARRFVAVMASLFMMFAATLGFALALALLDAGLALPSVLRAFGLAAWLTLFGVLSWGVVRRALHLRTNCLDVALELEQRFPRLNDSLASAVAFQLKDEAEQPTPGSRQLRRAAVQRASRMAERYDFRDVVQVGRCWQAFWACVCLTFLSAVLVAVFPQAATLAGLRFADPFGAHPWPPRTTVRILAPDQFPTRIAIGDGFVVRFRVQGELPADAHVQVRLDSGGEFVKVVPLHEPPVEATPAEPVSDHRERAVSFDSAQVPESFDFAVKANDGESGWQRVIVAPPPRLVLREGRASPWIHLEFPAYTRLPSLDLPDGSGVIEAPAGSIITLRAETDVRLRSAVIAYQGDRSAIERAAPFSAMGLQNPLGAFVAPQLALSLSNDFPVTLGPNGRTLDTRFGPSFSGLYALKFTDETGLTGTRLVEIRLQADPEPLVQMPRPSPQLDPAVLAPGVTIPVEALAEDPLFALRRFVLEYRLGKDQPYREVLLMDGPALAAASPALGGGWLTTSAPRPRQMRYQQVWPVAAFTHADGTPPRDGDILFLRAAADDWDDVSVAKQPGRSAERQFRILSRQSIEAHLQKELAGLRQDLLRVRNHQREARELTQQATPRLDGTLAPDDRERLLNAEQLQKQIQGKVADPLDGLRQRGDQLLLTARVNQLPPGSTRGRVEVMAENLGRLADRDLKAIEPLLGEARHVAGTPQDGGAKAVAQRLGRAIRYQQKAEKGFDAILEQLEQWGSAGEIAGEARTLRDALEHQANLTEQFREQLPATDSPETLTPAMRQQLEKAAGKLEQLADQASNLLAKSGRFAEERREKAATATAAAEAKTSAAEGAQRIEAAKLRANADAARQTARQAAAEEEALRNATREAGGQALPDDLRRAAAALRANRPGEATELQDRSLERLNALGEALVERPAAPASAIAKNGSNENIANRVDDLAEAQDQLRKKVRAAGRIADPLARQEEFQRLAREQDKIREQAQEMLQKLVRNRADASDLRAAMDQMEAARSDLERGLLPAQPQAEAIDRLEQARDKLDRGASPATDELSRETRRKMAEPILALRERQAAAEKEAERLLAEATKFEAWPRPLQASLNDLSARQRAIGEDVRTVAEKRFEPWPVLRRLLQDSSGAMETAATRIGERLEDIIAADHGDPFDAKLETMASRRFRDPMTLARHRLDQLLESLKEDEPKSPPEATAERPAAPPPADAATRSDADLIPPLAQIKVLRALQAELNERTAAFATAHPDPAALTEAEHAELKELEQAQRDIAGLFETIAEMFPMPTGEP